MSLYENDECVQKLSVHVTQLCLSVCVCVCVCMCSYDWMGAKNTHVHWSFAISTAYFVELTMWQINPTFYVVMHDCRIASHKRHHITHAFYDQNIYAFIWEICTFNIRTRY